MVSAVVGLRRLRLVAGCAAVFVGVWVLGVGVQPSRSDTIVTGFQTVTTYTGRIVFNYQFQQDSQGASGPQQFGSSDQDVYSWTEVDRDLIEPISFTKYKDTTYRDVVANGTRNLARFDTGAGTSGSAMCTISDDHKGEQLVGQQLLDGVPTVNPLTTVSWQIPNDVGPPDGRITETGVGTGDLAGGPGDFVNPCLNNTGATFLGYLLSCTVCVSYIAPTGNQAEYTNAWMGSATVHVRTLVRGFSRTFHAELTWSKTTPPNANIISGLEQGFAQVDSHVTSSFSQIKVTTFKSLPPELGPPPPRDCTKIGALLEEDGVTILGGPPPAPVSVPLGSRNRVLLPLAPTCKGSARLDVFGTVVPRANDRPAIDDASARRVAQRASASILLASTGTVHTKPSWGSPTLTLNPTSAGRRLLAGPHATIAITVRLRIAPVGARAITITQRGTIPASPG